jgi:hypothetical protein
VFVVTAWLAGLVIMALPVAVDAVAAVAALLRHKANTCRASCCTATSQSPILGVPVDLQLKFDDNFDDILDEGSSTHTPEQLPEWACA